MKVQGKPKLDRPKIARKRTGNLLNPKPETHSKITHNTAEHKEISRTTKTTQIQSNGPKPNATAVGEAFRGIFQTQEEVGDCRLLPRPAPRAFRVRRTLNP